MASGKASRRKRQEEQVRQVQAPKRRDTRQGSLDKRALALIGGALAVIAVIVVLVVVLTGGGSKTDYSATSKLPQAGQVQSLFAGVPQSGTTIGKASAPVTLVEYVDLQCPFCREFETKVFPEIVSKYVKTGKLRVEARPLSFIGPDSVTAAEAALNAAKQDHFFDFAELLYDNQGTENTGWVSNDLLAAAATSVGLDPNQVLSKLGDNKSKLDGFSSQAQKDNVTATPTLLVGKTGQAPTTVSLSSPTDKASLEAAIETALK